MITKEIHANMQHFRLRSLGGYLVPVGTSLVSPGEAAHLLECHAGCVGSLLTYDLCGCV